MNSIETQRQIREVLVANRVFNEFIRFIGSSENESGGIIGSKNKNIIDVFYFDKGRRSDANEYVPNVDDLQQQIMLWDKTHINFRGIIHSHTVSDRLSPRDIQMARKILCINNLSEILMPIYLIREQRIIWYEVRNDSVLYVDCHMIY